MTAVYNAGRFLLPSLQSVLTQEDVDLELIVVDDGSTDASPEALDACARSEIKSRRVSWLGWRARNRGA